MLGLPPLVSVVVLSGMEGEMIGTIKFLLVFLRIEGVH